MPLPQPEFCYISLIAESLNGACVIFLCLTRRIGNKTAPTYLTAAQIAQGQSNSYIFLDLAVFQFDNGAIFNLHTIALIVVYETLYQI
mmetsp:Transcript_10292/g.21661  ORF Transcript_10292/g.21661 Transcript_10292/m.21661 type:complete len:88 (+) Transcript_10292:58-321(+)